MINLGPKITASEHLQMYITMVNEAELIPIYLKYKQDDKYDLAKIPAINLCVCFVMHSLHVTDKILTKLCRRQNKTYQTCHLKEKTFLL